MLQEEFLLLDDLALPNKYVTPSTDKDLAYVASFRQVCKRYSIDFISANQDKRDFVIRLAEKDFAQKQAPAEQMEGVQNTVHVVQTLVGAIPPTDLPLQKLREERLKKYGTT